jgi:hypothetical protein
MKRLGKGEGWEESRLRIQLSDRVLAENVRRAGFKSPVLKE